MTDLPTEHDFQSMVRDAEILALDGYEFEKAAQGYADNLASQFLHIMSSKIVRIRRRRKEAYKLSEADFATWQEYFTSAAKSYMEIKRRMDLDGGQFELTWPEAGCLLDPETMTATNGLEPTKRGTHRMLMPMTPGIVRHMHDSRPSRQIANARGHTVPLKLFDALIATS